MLVVEEREKKADYDRLEPALLEGHGGLLDLVERERHFDLAGWGPQPFIHDEPVPTLDQGLRLPRNVEL